MASPPVHDLSLYDSSKWVRYGNGWLYQAGQVTPGWLLVRLGRGSGSTIGACIDHSTFDSVESIALQISGRIEKKFSERSIENMAHGTKTEPFARAWYCKDRNCEVEELGMVMPDWNKNIGFSTDGIVVGTPGKIEIKCPKKMYWPLKNYMKQIREGVEVKGFDHIWETHYDQMILGMAVLEKKWCDYIVYCTPEDLVFVQRIPFNEKYWKEELYPKFLNFVETKLNPLLDGTPFPLMPPGFK